MYDDGTVRYSYVSVKQILEVFRLLCQDRAQAYETLCDVFSDETNNGAEMSVYSDLLKKAIQANSKRVEKKIAVQVKTNSNTFLIPEEEEELPKETAKPDPSDAYELIT